MNVAAVTIPMELTTEILEACYRAGAFPMADAYGRIEFYRSDPRSVLEFEDLHVPRSLERVIRREPSKSAWTRTSKAS